MKNILLLFLIVFLSFACNRTKQSENQDKHSKIENNTEWATYHNARFDFSISYPNFLIPQGESGNGDGQKFISEDEKFQFWAYVDFKMNKNFDDIPSFDEAYEQDINKENIEFSSMEYDYYYIYGQLDENTVFAQYTYFYNLTYYVLYFQYPKAEEAYFIGFVETIENSFAYKNDESQYVVDFIYEFLNDCWTNKNFNALLRDNAQDLQKYIDEDLDIIRFHSPGAIPQLATRAENFGFDKYTDFTTVFNVEYSVLSDESLREFLCDLDFGEDGARAYYEFTNELPNLVDPETYEVSSIKSRYPESKIMTVYLPNKYHNPLAFYFILINKTWKLIIVDDSLCSA